MRTQNQSTTEELNRQKPRAFRAYFALALILCFGTQALNAQKSTPRAPQTTRVVVRTNLGLNGILNLCKLLGCSKAETLEDPQGQLFMIETPAALNIVTSLLNIRLLGIVSVETDQNVQTQEASAGPAPSYLTDKAPFSYYGTTVWHGYVYQPGNQLIRTDATHSAFSAAGSGVIVADIDTGVDPTHPVLKNVLLAGYDFITDPSQARDGDARDPNPRDEGTWGSESDCGVAENSFFHGLFVAGQIAANTNNGIGIREALGQLIGAISGLER